MIELEGLLCHGLDRLLGGQAECRLRENLICTKQGRKVSQLINPAALQTIPGWPALLLTVLEDGQVGSESVMSCSTSRKFPELEILLLLRPFGNMAWFAVVSREAQ